jgi:hypothetical protein
MQCNAARQSDIRTCLRAEQHEGQLACPSASGEAAHLTERELATVHPNEVADIHSREVAVTTFKPGGKGLPYSRLL